MRRIILGALLLASTAAAEPRVNQLAQKDDPLATTERWGGGIRLTGLSGIGMLPDRNFGAEVAVHVRRDEMFVELGLGRWKPEETYTVSQTADTRTDLKLDVWALRAGWSSMKMPLRGWLLAEVGEVAGARGMQGVVSRMVMGDTPQSRQWRAAGGGFGVAWPMSNQAALVGNFEAAIPLKRETQMLDHGGTYEPYPLIARFCVGIEVGWR